MTQYTTIICTLLLIIIIIRYVLSGQTQNQNTRFLYDSGFNGNRNLNDKTLFI